ncbi:MAG: hypothetical protein K0R54_806 [Clostridiaceae bacterium]|jgi:hypothetical protein|nr:hypothetical protein [Clostridiaceae bacterium]
MLKEDLEELSLQYGLKVNEDNTLTLYHATSEGNAEKIIATNKMYGKENGLFFSTSPKGQISGYGTSIVELLVPIDELELDDQFDNELHFKIVVKPYQHYQVKAIRYFND